MRLVDLDPRWLMKEGRRIGFMFISPKNPRFFQSCFFQPTTFRDQCAAFVAARGGDDEDREFGRPDIQPCNANTAWTPVGDIASLDFATLTVTPSLDGSAGGLWHGFITNGQIVGDY